MKYYKGPWQGSRKSICVTVESRTKYGDVSVSTAIGMSELRRASRSTESARANILAWCRARCSVRFTCTIFALHFSRRLIVICKSITDDVDCCFPRADRSRGPRARARAPVSRLRLHSLRVQGHDWHEYRMRYVDLQITRFRFTL